MGRIREESLEERRARRKLALARKDLRRLKVALAVVALIPAGLGAAWLLLGGDLTPVTGALLSPAVAFAAVWPRLSTAPGLGATVVAGWLTVVLPLLFFLGWFPMWSVLLPIGAWSVVPSAWRIERLARAHPGLRLSGD